MLCTIAAEVCKTTQTCDQSATTLPASNVPKHAGVKTGPQGLFYNRIWL